VGGFGKKSDRENTLSDNDQRAMVTPTGDGGERGRVKKPTEKKKEELSSERFNLKS